MPGDPPPPALVIDATDLDHPGLRLVERLCRAGLTARRLECRIEVVGATPELRRLLEALGLAGVLPCADGSGGVDGPLGLEAEG